MHCIIIWCMSRTDCLRWKFHLIFFCSCEHKLEYRTAVQITAYSSSAWSTHSLLTNNLKHELTMYCLQWMLPILLVPKSACAMVMQDQMLVILLYMLAFFIERRPCVLCVLVFVVAVVVLCASGVGHTILCEWSPSMIFSSMCTTEGQRDL